QRCALGAGQRAVLDGPHARPDREPQTRPAVGVSGRIGAGPFRLFHGGADLVPRVRARRGHGTWRADAARDEDLHVVGAAPEVLARAAAHFVDAVVARQRATVAVVGGEAPAGHQQPRGAADTRVVGVAGVDVGQ